ncbi:MAG TPA: BamA/TamA family outer membrane protein [Lacunisphaera sp.]|nr:BamA/TamA family outer membrane protein [Lacunisphaera sp.]
MRTRANDFLRAAGAALLLVSVLAGAEVSVRGAGPFADRNLRRTLDLLVEPKKRPTLDAGAIEDAALILVAELQNDGYLRPVVRVRVHRDSGATEDFSWDESLATLLPRPLAAPKVEFHLQPGVRYTVDDVAIQGLSALPEKQGKAYFRDESYLLPLASTRIYTPARFARAQSNLEEELKQRGYASARVQGTEAARDDHSGKVRVSVTVDEGPRWVVDRIELADEKIDPVPPPAFFQRHIGLPYSSIWRQDTEARLRRFYHERGYVDATVALAAEPGEPAHGLRPVVIRATIQPGPKVMAGPVEFKGSTAVKPAVLQRQVHLVPGEPLNPAEVAEARQRLMRLGVFRGVETSYDPAAGTTRSPVYTLERGREQDFNLLLGWGSYERLRGGVEYQHYNLFSRAHQVRADVIQSTKSSSGEVNYLVPQLFGESIDGTARLFGLHRQERAFERQEFGGSFGVKRHLHTLGGDLGVTYTYQSLRVANSTLSTAPVDLGQTNVGSVDLTFNRDALDNPLRPRRGYRLFVRSELAAKALGGEVDYQRVELGGAWHTPWGRGRWIHVGMTHGVITTFGNNGAGLPANKRFYPGGENTVRGYQEGEAAPRAADGSFVGAKTYTLLNLEFEQALTRDWSVVTFGDALGISDRLGSYPWNEVLTSVGLGLRYNSLVGPIRLEYGYNLNRRPNDPSGTLHFSVGFPF